MKYLAALAVLGTVATGAVGADEAWRSQSGDIIYLEDREDVAIFRQGDPISGPRHLYFPGLARDGVDRAGTTFYGYWIDADETGRKTRWDRCGATLSGADGITSDQFGMIEIEFDHAGFPSGFTAASGTCFAPAMENVWRAEPAMDLDPVATGLVTPQMLAGTSGAADCIGDSIFPLSTPFDFRPDTNYYSPCGEHYLRFQSDGNLVIYTRSGRPIWALNSLVNYSPNARASFQSDGNLATYDGRGRYVWSARHVASPPGSRLEFTAQGELHIVGPDGSVLWNSGRQSR
ncbi:hypothetical protein [Maricaulis sp. CAU 1757]